VFGKIGMEHANKSTQYLDLANAKNKCYKLLNPLKEIYKVDKIYVGHTPLMDHGISSVCNGKVWLTDFGASKAFNKFDKHAPPTSDIDKTPRSNIRKAQVLEILNDGGKINILKNH
jgi:fructose-1,6-bisphosphatase